MSDCACACVCVRVVRALPLLTRVRRVHLLSHLLKRTDAAALFEFNSQLLLFKHTSNTTWTPDHTEAPHFLLLATGMFYQYNDAVEGILHCHGYGLWITSPLTHIHIFSSLGCINILASCCLLKFFLMFQVLCQYPSIPSLFSLKHASFLRTQCKTGVVGKTENTSLTAHSDVKYVLTVESVIVFTNTSQGERITVFF